MRDGQVTAIELPPTFYVLLSGAQPGIGIDALSERLAPMFKRTPEQMFKALSGPSVVVKRGLDEAMAQRYVAALLQAGATCSIEIEAVVAAPLVDETPAVAALPVVSEEPAAQVVPVTAEEPAAIPAIAEEASAPILPVVAEEPAALALPVIADEPAALAFPSITEEPAALAFPVVSEEPAAFVLPVISEEPAAFVLPLISEEPAALVLPVVSEEPAEFVFPVVSEEPAEFVFPVASEEPAAIVAPLISDEPIAVDAEAPPALVEAPVSLSKPAPSLSLSLSLAPIEEAPEIALAPVETVALANEPATAKVVLDKAGDAPAAEPDDAMQRWLKHNKIDPNAPPAPASSTDEPEQDSWINLPMSHLATGQKLIIDAILLNAVFGSLQKQIAFPLFWAIVCALGIGSLCIYGVLRIAEGLKLTGAAKVMTAIGAAIPLLGIVVLIVLNMKARSQLRDAGYTVGFWGVPGDERAQMSGNDDIIGDRKYSLAALGLMILCATVASNTKPKLVDAYHPCELVGQWTMTRGDLVYEMTLAHDGSYAAKPIAPVTPKMHILYGLWEVRYGKLVWYEAGNGFEIARDKNDFKFESPTSFTLQESDGRPAHYARTAELEGSCSK